MNPSINLHRTTEARLSLIYIASIGRSGSTLLELLLHTHAEIWTLGELYVLPWYIYEKRGFCGCGQILSKCGFWKPVIDKMRGLLRVDGNIALYRESFSSGRFFRPRQLFGIFLGRRFDPPADTARFCLDNVRLLAEIQSRVEQGSWKPVSYLVDASKDFYRLHRLCGCQAIDLKVIHIVKDPRAYIYSRMKGNRTVSVAILVKVLRLCLKYTIENLLIGMILKELPAKNTFFLRYEDLAARPAKVVKSICQWLQLPTKQPSPNSFRGVVNHGVAGNEMRHRNEGIILDQRWKSDLPHSINRLTSAITLFLAKSYGYKVP